MATSQTRIALKKGHNLSILARLAVNYLLLLQLKVHKWLHGIRRPIVHYYAVCWNEEKMLPFVFDHYAPFVEEFYFYDNHSTDRSRDIIRAHPNAHVVDFGTEGCIDDRDYKRMKDQAWKRSRGRADYVIVCDIDEFLYHPDLEAELRRLHSRHVSLPPAEGYEMYSRRFPCYPDDSPLTRSVRRGVRSQWLDKQLLFDPHRIVEVNFEEGAHRCHPWGLVSRGGTTFKVLHYKHLGTDYLLRRYASLASRLSDYNRTHQLGMHYTAKEQEIQAEMEQGLREAQVVVQ